MKKMLLLLFSTITILLAQDKTAQVVYDLTTKNMETFERKILKAIVANKAHYEGLLSELDVVVVIHGEAYKFFTKNPLKSIYKEDKVLTKSYKSLAKRIKSMAENYEVEFLMCKAGMAKRELKKSDIYKFVDIVPNSTIGLIDKQNEGYAYIPVD
jgi:intracellular sulfur oxidation DsrE/DsrF family protein